MVADLGRGERGGDEEGWIADAVRAHATRIARQVKGVARRAGHARKQGPAAAPRGRDDFGQASRRTRLAYRSATRCRRGVPVAGVDRLRLTAPLAVQDLLAAIRVRAPAAGRPRARQFAGLAADRLEPGRIHARRDEAARRTVGSPSRRRSRPSGSPHCWAMLRRADFTTPYVFLEELLTGPLDGRRKLLRLLGPRSARPDRRTTQRRASSSSELRFPRCSAFSIGSIAATSRSCAIRRPRSTRSA